MNALDGSFEGVRALSIDLKSGDVSVCVALADSWRVEYGGGRDGAPLVERTGDALRITGQGVGHMNISIVAPSTLDRVDVDTGYHSRASGAVTVEGVRGYTRLHTGCGPVTLRGAGGQADIQTGAGAVVVEGFEGTLSAASGAGSITATGLNGEAKLHTGAGRITVHDVDGHLTAHSGSGDVVVTSGAGEATLHSGFGTIAVESPRGLAVAADTGMGGVRVGDGVVRDLKLKSNMGAVHCSAVLMQGRHELETAMGAVTLILPDDAAARIDAQTTFGSVTSAFPLVRVGRSGPMGFGGVRMVGTIGGEAQTDVTLRSSKGAISIKRRAAGEVLMPVPFEVTAPHTQTSNLEKAADSTLAVLEALARGEVTPAEAEDLLHGVAALGRPAKRRPRAFPGYAFRST